MRPCSVFGHHAPCHLRIPFRLAAPHALLKHCFSYSEQGCEEARGTDQDLRTQGLEAA